MNGNLMIFPDIDRLSLAAAELFVETAQQAVQQRGRLLVALSGGSTPQRLFRMLAEQAFLARIPWISVHFFWCDERCVLPEDPESNFGQANRALFRPLDLLETQLHRIPGELGAEQAAAAYAESLYLYRDAGLDWPAFDLVLLGLGSDGHTASLFPGTMIPDHVPVLPVSANYQGRPACRVTLTPVVFNSARQVLFLVAGADKAGAVANVLLEPQDHLRFPAQRIQPIQGIPSWFIAADAAQNLFCS